MVTAELKKLVEQKVNETLLATNINVPIEIKYDLNSARLNGYASWKLDRIKNTVSYKIRLNPVHLVHSTEKYLRTTLVHEVCHIVAVEKHGFGIKPHGKEWKNLMRSVGAEPSRCNSYQLPANVTVGKKQKRHAVRCPNCLATMQVSTTIKNRIRCGHRYKHTACGTKQSIVLI